jgi:hypothetical protein
MTKETQKDKESEESKNLIHLDMNETVAQGAYSNLALANVNQEEFIIDFVFLQPHVNKGQVRSRVIMSPKNVKRLVKMLEGQLNEYEKNMGPIGDEPQLPGINLSFN